MTLKELAYHVMQMRDLQMQYFASGKPRFRDKALLAKSKAKEAEVDTMVERVLMQEIASGDWDKWANPSLILQIPADVDQNDLGAIIKKGKEKEYIYSFFEQNAIFGNETDSDAYKP